MTPRFTFVVAGGFAFTHAKIIKDTSVTYSVSVSDSKMGDSYEFHIVESIYGGKTIYILVGLILFSYDTVNPKQPPGQGANIP